MTRIGTNPSRSKKLDFSPPRVTVAVLVHAPNQAGYFQHRLDVTRLTIESIIHNTNYPISLLVFDNGSCPEMVDFLQQLLLMGKIDQLILSKRNVGKLNALYQIFQVASSEVIAYTDDDVYHLPGWLEQHLKILDTFPNVGAVTGFYIRQRVALSSDATVKFAKEEAESIRSGLLMPPKWETEYMVNSGRSLERYQSEIKGIEDIIVGWKGLEAWVSAHHFQFVSTKKVLIPILKEMLPSGWSDLKMGRMVEMDDLMDGRGHLRLTTLDQTVKLLGNKIDDEMIALAETHGISITSQASLNRNSKGHNLFKKSKLVRNGLQWLENKLYKMINTD